jgi:hypothetical protein
MQLEILSAKLATAEALNNFIFFISKLTRKNGQTGHGGSSARNFNSIKIDKPS